MLKQNLQFPYDESVNRTCIALTRASRRSFFALITLMTIFFYRETRVLSVRHARHLPLYMTYSCCCFFFFLLQEPWWNADACRARARARGGVCIARRCIVALFVPRRVAQYRKRLLASRVHTCWWLLRAAIPIYGPFDILKGGPPSLYTIYTLSIRGSFLPRQSPPPPPASTYTQSNSLTIDLFANPRDDDSQCE